MAKVWYVSSLQIASYRLHTHTHQDQTVLHAGLRPAGAEKLKRDILWCWFGFYLESHFFYPSLPPVSLSLILKGGSFWISFGQRQKNTTQGFPHLMVSSSLSFWFCLLYPHTSFVLGCVENGKVLTLQCHTSKKKSAKEINHFCQSVPTSSKAQSRFGALESWTACSRNKN